MLRLTNGSGLGWPATTSKLTPAKFAQMLQGAGAGWPVDYANRDLRRPAAMDRPVGADLENLRLGINLLPTFDPAEKAAANRLVDEVIGRSELPDAVELLRLVGELRASFEDADAAAVAGGEKAGG